MFESPSLERAVAAFTSDVAAALDAATAGVASADRSRFAGDVANEAYNISLAMVASDGRHSEDELRPIIAAFALRLPDGVLERATPDSIRSSGVLHSAVAFLDHPSDLFEILVTADAANGTRFGVLYVDRALALAHEVVALDAMPTSGELEAIARFRSVLIGRVPAAVKTNGEASPGAERPGAPPSGAPAAGATPPSGAAPPSGAEGPAGAGGSPATAAATTDSAHGAAADPPPPPRPVEELLAELRALVGLADVKREIERLTDLLAVQKLRMDRGLSGDMGSLHLIFAGNPGTGKTTVARLLAEIYRSLGIVKGGRLVEADRATLVAKFVGHTAVLVTQRFDEADGGVLFIDEAYALMSGGDSDFGQEAIDTIVKLAEDRRDRVVVIMAGYPDEMSALIDTNPGLRSRFPKTIFFADYSTDELVEILRTTAERRDYQLTAAALSRVHSLLDREPRGHGFGNARVARNLLEETIARQAERIVNIGDPETETLTTIEAGDVPDRVPGHVDPDQADLSGATHDRFGVGAS